MKKILLVEDEEMLAFIAGEKLTTHHFIGINPKDGKVYITAARDNVIGMTARDIKKGEGIICDPSGNTKDVIRKNYDFECPDETFHIISGEDIHMHYLIKINPKTKKGIVMDELTKYKDIIGMAMRHIKKGEIFEYNPNDATKDVITKGNWRN